MPPKGKKTKSKKKHADHHVEARLPSERETALRTRLDQKAQHLVELKMRVHTAEEQKEWLTREAHRLQIETGEYKRFMSKKTNLRQTQLVTLSDHHRQEIENIHRDQEIMLDNYRRRKEELRLQLIDKSQLLLQVQRELEDMDGYQIIREQQSDEIKRLEVAVKQTRAEQVHDIDSFKSNFDKEVDETQAYEDIHLEEIGKQAKQEAEQYLYDRTLMIQSENTGLKRRIRDIFRRQQGLNQLRQQLEEEQLYLIGRLKLAADLKRVRLEKVLFNTSNKPVKSITHKEEKSSI